LDSAWYHYSPIVDDYPVEELCMPNPMIEVEISQATEVTDELYQACQRLVEQLTDNNPPPTRQQLVEMLVSQSSILYLARHPDFGDEIIGMATLVIYVVPTGVRGYIEDVVVDERARGSRIGEELMRVCLERAEREGAPQVMLTCNPGRTAANRMYKRIGFDLRKTNVYRYGFKRG
jgi:ribosomal protein S18 acetylase RimI-like enzyme